MKRLSISVIFLVIVIVFVVGGSLILRTPALAGEQPLILQRPSFVDVAYAEEANVADIGNKLDNEAGISAYLHASSSINLSQIRSLFRTIEAETKDYIIGSIQAPNYKENYDVHVYVHKDGWILAYYLKEDPASKIIDVKASSLDTNILRTVIGTVAATAGLPLTDVNYYDFRYPNATNLLFVAENAADGNDFEITLPQEYAYLESSWSYGVFNAHDRCFIIDGVNYVNGNADYWDGGTAYDKLEVSELLPGSAHTIAVCAYDYGALVIVYRVP